MLIAGVGMLIGGVVTAPGLVLSSDPGSRRSIKRGDCPEKPGRDAGALGGVFASSNKLKLFVTESGSSRGRGSSRRYGGVLISNMGGWSK